MYIYLNISFVIKSIYLRVGDLSQSNLYYKQYSREFHYSRESVSYAKDTDLKLINTVHHTVKINIKSINSKTKIKFKA